MGISFVGWILLRTLFGLRVAEDDEIKGLDLSELGIEAYPEFSKN